MSKNAVNDQCGRPSEGPVRDGVDSRVSDIASPLDWFEMLLPSLDSGGTDSGGTDSGGTDSGGTDSGDHADFRESPSPAAVQWGFIHEESTPDATVRAMQQLAQEASSGESSADSRSSLPHRDTVQSPPVSAAAGTESSLAITTRDDSDGGGIAAVPAAGDWIDRLRQWEHELGQRAVEAERRSADLDARRRQFARLLRQQARTLRQQDHAATTADLAGQRLSDLQQQIESLVEYLCEAWPPAQPDSDANRLEPTWSQPDSSGLQNPGDSPEQQASLLGDGPEADGQSVTDELHFAEIESLNRKIDSLVEQNDQLARELAHHTVRRAVSQSSDAHASLSWEERKALLFKQFEAEDNGEIVVYENGAADHAVTEEAAREEIERLREENARLKGELKARDLEISEMRTLLENRPEVAGDGLTVGAASIARLLDGDELVQCERDRLKEIQEEWEGKFRELEIATSIERANLARQRRELECKNAELEEQLVHLQREIKQDAIAGPNQPTRWLAKLGLRD